MNCLNISLTYILLKENLFTDIGIKKNIFYPDVDKGMDV